MADGIIINPNLMVYFATITVTYPSGSTLTCTCGSDSFTAETTSGSYTFVVPYAGTWTVKATKGSQSKSANVSVTTYNQAASVTLSYEVYIPTNTTSGWSTLHASERGGDNVTTSNGVLCFNRDSSDWAYTCIYRLSTPLNLSQAKTFTFDAESDSWGDAFRVQLRTQLPTSYVDGDNWVVAQTTLKWRARNTYTIDISSLTGTAYYLTVRCFTTGAKGTQKFYSIYYV